MKRYFDRHSATILSLLRVLAKKKNRLKAIEISINRKDEMNKTIWEDYYSRDFETYNIPNFKFLDLLNELTKLKTENNTLKETVERYADVKNWRKQNQRAFTITSKDDVEENGNLKKGGLLARECLNRIKERGE